MKKLYTFYVLIALFVSFSLNAQNLQNTSWTMHSHKPNGDGVSWPVTFAVDTIHYTTPNGNIIHALYEINSCGVFSTTDIWPLTCTVIGTYNFIIENDTLDFTTIEDECEPREYNMSTSIFVRNTLSLPENSSLTNLMMYPNPATDQLILKRTQGDLIDIKILDQTGRLVIETQSNSEKVSIEINGLTPGIYYVLVKDAASSLTKKLMVIPY